MMVYVVTEKVDGGTLISGVYAKYEDAKACAEDLAEYAGLEPNDIFPDAWGEDIESPDCEACVMIEPHRVIA